MAGGALASAAWGGAAWGAEAVVFAALRGLRAPVVAVLGRTLLQPLRLPPAVVAAWAAMRDIGFLLLTAVLLYGVVHEQVGRLAGWPTDQPWSLLPRLALGALGVATSMALVRGLLAADAALTAAIVQAVPGHGASLSDVLTAGLLAGVVPGVLGLGADVAALALLLGVAALACFYVVRAAEIVLLTLMLPLAAALWVVPAAAGVWRALLGELLVAVFVQPAQATVLLVFAAGLAPDPGAVGAWLWGLAALALLFRVRGLLARAVAGAGRWLGEEAPLAVTLGALRAAVGQAERLATALPAMTRLPEP